MTVEASMIMPFVLYICIFVIYLGFYMYDRCILTQDCYRIALRGSSIYKDDKQIVYKTAYEYMKKITADKIIIRDFHYEIGVNHQVCVKCYSNYEFPFTILKKIAGKDKWTFEIEEKSSCINTALWIRLCRKLLSQEGE